MHSSKLQTKNSNVAGITMDKRTRVLMHSSKNMDEVTPQNFFEQIDREFKFTVDLAADAKNTKCKRYYDEASDALAQDWKSRGWCNPPYGRAVPKWVKKAADEDFRNGGLTVMLLVPRTDTQWFKNAAATADEIRFIEGRLTFEGQEHPAPFPSCLVIWYGKYRVAPYVPHEDDQYTYNLIWRR